MRVIRANPWLVCLLRVLHVIRLCLSASFLRALRASAVNSLLSTTDNRPLTQKIFTARAASKTTMVREINDCNIMPTFAQRDRTAVSVGEKAVLVLNARKR